VLLEACKAGELIANFDDTILIRLEEETYVAVVDYGDVLVFSSFLRGELHVGVYPSLKMLESVN
jgi:hypothetical protein